MTIRANFWQQDDGFSGHFELPDTLFGPSIGQITVRGTVRLTTNAYRSNLRSPNESRGIECWSILTPKLGGSLQIASFYERNC